MKREKYRLIAMEKIAVQIARKTESKNIDNNGKNSSKGYKEKGKVKREKILISEQ